MKSNGDRVLTAIFCDDIRHEMGNKMSFMGCYQGELVVQGAALPGSPVALPKLCIYIGAWTRKEQPFKQLTLRIVQDDAIELARIEVPVQQLEDIAPASDPTATRRTTNAAMVFSPFVIEKPVTLRVMAITENGELVGPRLLVKIAEVQPSTESVATDSATATETGKKAAVPAKKKVSVPAKKSLTPKKARSTPLTPVK